MRQKIDIWRTDRLPTRVERYVGVIASILVTAAFIAISVMALLLESYIVLAAFLLATGFIARIAYRVAFMNPELPSLCSVKVVNYICIVCGLCLLLASPFAPLMSQSFYGALLGLAGVWAGLYNLRHQND